MSTIKQPDLKLSELIERYTDSSEFRNLRPASQRAYSIYLGRLRPLHHRWVSGLTRSDIHRIWDQHQGYPGAQATLVKVTRRIFTWGLGWDVIHTAPMIPSSRRMGADRPKPHPMWSDVEITKFRAAAMQYEHKFVLEFFEIGLATGQRIGDICNSMHTKNWDGVTFKLTQTKTGVEVQFRPAGAFKRILEEAVAEGRKYVLSMPPPYHGRDRRLRYHFDAVRDLAGVEGTPHGLRKTVAVKLREMGATSEQAGALLGHLTGRMVDDYAEEARRTVLATAAAVMISQIMFE